jgi:hypothetical protein
VSNSSQVRSKQRVADHGEVFTPAWMVEAMPDLVKDESERIDSRFLEPACGSGNFLVRVLQRKLTADIPKTYDRNTAIDAIGYQAETAAWWLSQTAASTGTSTERNRVSRRYWLALASGWADYSA